MDPNSAYALVLETLHRACSQEVEVLKPAEKKLQEWATEPGFYTLLFNIFSNYTVDTNVRWLAVLCFKNGVDRYWRKNAPNGISEEEKHSLREALLTPPITNEPVYQVATQIAVLVAKIARYDCPTHWPQLVPTLLNKMKSPTALEQHRSLIIFHGIVKTLSVKRLAVDRRIFQELTSNVLTYILAIWDEHTQIFLRMIQEGGSTELITEHMEKALFALKILRKLIMFGLKKTVDNQDAVLFLNVIFDKAKLALECRKMLRGRGSYILEQHEKFIIFLTKVAMGVLSTDPVSCVFMVRPTLQFATYFAFSEEGSQFLFERFTIQCLNLIKTILHCAEYKLSRNRELNDNGVAASAHEAKMSVLTEDTVKHMCRHLVTHLFLLTSDELALWDADPESFATDEAYGTYKCSLRPCVEALFLILFREFRVMLAPELVRLLELIGQQPLNPLDLTTILRKDAVYNAVGLAAFDLYDDIDFDDWFSKGLLTELRIKDNNFRIIRRRVAWLIGKWSCVKVSSDLRPALYEALLELLAPIEDTAVRLAACDALSQTIDDFDFSAERFTPFLQLAFTLLFDLLKEADECDTKMHVLRILSFVAERNGEAVPQHVEGLLRYLPQLWEHAEQHNMLRCAIVSTLVQLVKALGSWDVSDMCPLILGVLEEATDTKRPAHVYLLEDGLELWRVVLVCTPTNHPYSQNLLMLANNLPALMDLTTEYLWIIVYVARAYVLLMPEEFLMGAGGEVLRTMDSMLSDMKMEGVLVVLKLVEACVRAPLPQRNQLLGIKVVWPTLLRVMKSLQTGEDLPTVLSLQLSIISRLFLISNSLFLQCAGEASIDGNNRGDSTETIARLLDVCCERMHLVTQLHRRKVVGLFLSTLLSSQIPCVLDRFPSIVLVLVEVLNDIMKGDDPSQQVDGLVPMGSTPPSPCSVSYSNEDISPFVMTHHDARWRMLAENDLVHTVDLRNYLSLKLSELQNLVGHQTFSQLIQSVEASTLQQLREYIPV